MHIHTPTNRLHTFAPVTDVKRPNGCKFWSKKDCKPCACMCEYDAKKAANHGYVCMYVPVNTKGCCMQCVYVSYVHKHVRTWSRRSLRPCVGVHIHTYVRMHANEPTWLVYMYVCMYALLCAYKQRSQKGECQKYRGWGEQQNTNMYTCIHICTHIHICICVYICTCVCVHIYIYIYIYI
jgi:hypothetical protein